MLMKVTYYRMRNLPKGILINSYDQPWKTLLDLTLKPGDAIMTKE